MFERLTYHYGENNEHADFITIKKDGYARYRASCEGALKLAAYEDSGLSPEEVQKMARAKAEGRLVVLPLKVGSTIYRLEAPQYSWEIVSATIYLDETIFTDDSDNIIKETDIGKTVFLTRKEAEKALQEGMKC